MRNTNTYNNSTGKEQSFPKKNVHFDSSLPLLNAIIKKRKTLTKIGRNIMQLRQNFSVAFVLISAVIAGQLVMGLAEEHQESNEVSANTLRDEGNMVSHDFTKNSVIQGHLRNSYSSLDMKDYHEDSLEWPWNRKNSTSNNSCSSHQNCTACTEASMTCHWCAHDEQCHVKGSWSGCTIGATCKKPSNDTKDNRCAAHKTCTECTLSSNLCHYCAFDNECHAIGSVYGCTHGVNCYSNDRCHRKKPEPEPIQPRIFDEIGTFPLILIFTIAIGIISCSSIIFVGAKAVKSAYDDYVADRVPPAEAFTHQAHRMLDLDPIQEDSEDENEQDDEENKPGDEDAVPKESKEEEKGHPSESIKGDEEAEENCEESNGCEEEAAEDDDGSDEESDWDPLTERLLSPVPDPSRMPTRNERKANKYMNCMIRTCSAWYMFSIFFAVSFAASSILFFPKVPEVNVCSDEFAWKSIIDSLTSLKMEASFEILTSVKNKNRLDVALEGISGTFRHDGEEVGSFEIKDTVIAASSISDVLVTCTVAPDRWESLGLITDYYRDKLQFLVNASGKLRIKGIGFAIPIKEEDIPVKANKSVTKKDRELCACPQWKDVYPTKSPVMSFEEAMESVKIPFPSKREAEVVSYE